MGRKIKATDAKTGKPIEVDADSIKTGPIRNRSLPDHLLRRVKALHARLKGVYDVNLEQFEITFMRDSDPKARSPSGNASCRRSSGSWPPCPTSTRRWCCGHCWAILWPG
jgi:hypothetical protein